MLKFILLVLILTGSLQGQAAEGFFSNPKTLTPEDVLEHLGDKSLDMCWQFGKHDFFHFITKKDQVYFEIILDKVPDSFSESTKNLFIKSKNTPYFFSYDGGVINHPRKEQRELGADTPSYLVAERRVFELPNPQPLKESDLLSIIANKNVLFYTGAGLSVAAGVASMAQLNDLLGLRVGEEFIFSLREALEHPEEFSQKILSFHNACFFSPPTEAHNALAKLALFKNTKIVTENLDCLHEHSGISPYRVKAEELREWGSASIKNIDYIICLHNLAVE